MLGNDVRVQPVTRRLGPARTARTPRLTPRSPVLAVAREMLGGPQTSFLLTAPTEPGGYLRVMALGMPQDTTRHLSLVVVLSPARTCTG